MTGASDEPAAEALLDFVNAYLDDLGCGAPLPLAEYLRRWPEAEAAIAREYVRLVDIAALDAAADPRNTVVAGGSAAAAAGAAERRFGHYLLQRELGRGGQAVVYLARDERLPRPVALKVLRDAEVTVGGDAFARFQREAELVSKLDHPSICAVYETGVVDGAHYIAMRFVDGGSLAEWIARGAPGTATALPDDAGGTTATGDARSRNFRVLELIEATARALEVAHRAGVVHRDVKPSNILVGRTGVPVLVDFGLAFDAGSAQPSLTRTGLQFGTPAYMSPEQVRADGGRPDWRTDIYSLGVTLYEALTGAQPFAAPTREGLYRAILEARPRHPCRQNPTLPRELGVVLATAMDPDPDRRYRSAAELADDLQRVRLLQPIRAEPPSWLLRCRRWVQRNRVAAAFIGLLAVGLVSTSWLLVEIRASRAGERASLEKLDRTTLGALVRDVADSLWPEAPAGEARLREFAADAVAHARARLAYWEARSNKLPADFALIDDLRAFITAPGGAMDVVARRLRRIAELREQTLVAAAPQWQDALAAVARSPRYPGPALAAPIFGLVPIGVDPTSGLLELWHPRSGARPQRDAGGRLRIGADSGLVFVLLPGGRFWMGAERPGADPGAGHNVSALAEPDEAPVTAVDLAAFLIAKFEVSQGQWRRLTGDQPSEYTAGDHYPVERVTWEEADTWLRRFALRLPTEAQWEYACRAGSETPWWTGAGDATLLGAANLGDESLRRQYPDRTAAWPFTDGFARTAPVASLEPNPFGLHHVHGNVAEWCADRYGPPVPPRPGDGLRIAADPPRAGGPRDYRVYRGGHFEWDPHYARSSYRGREGPGARAYWLGLRPVIAVPP